MNVPSRFTFNLVLLILSNLLIKPLWILGIDRMVQNQAGPAVWGSYFAVFNFSLLFGVLLDPGIHNFSNRAVSRHPHRLGAYLINFSLLKGILSLGYFIFTFCLALLTGFDTDQQHWLFILLINQILLQTILFFRAQIGALQHFRMDAFFSVSDKLIALMACLLLLYRNDELPLDAFLYAQTASLLITAFLAGLYVYRQPRTNADIWPIRKFTRVLKITRGFAWLAFFMAVYFRADGILLNRLLGEGDQQEAGIYAAAYRILDAANMFAFLLSTLLLPLFASHIRKNKDVTPLVFYSTNLLWTGGTALCMLCITQANFIVPTLYPTADDYWQKVFQVLMMAFVPISSVYVFGTLLTAHGSMGPLIRIAITGMLITLILQCLTIPFAKALGAAVATVMAQLVIAALHIFAARKHFAMAVFRQHGYAYILQLAGTIAAAYALNSLSVHPIICCVTIPVVSAGLSWGTGLLKRESMRQIQPTARQ